MTCRYAEAILAYVALEVSAKKLKEARSIFKKFHRRKFHDSGGLTVCKAWLLFEQEHGTAEDFHHAFGKTEPVLSEAAAEATAAVYPQTAAETKVVQFVRQELPSELSDLPPGAFAEDNYHDRIVKTFCCSRGLEYW